MIHIPRSDHSFARIILEVPISDTAIYPAGRDFVPSHDRCRIDGERDLDLGASNNGRRGYDPVGRGSFDPGEPEPDGLITSVSFLSVCVATTSSGIDSRTRSSSMSYLIRLIFLSSKQERELLLVIDFPCLMIVQGRFLLRAGEKRRVDGG